MRNFKRTLALVLAVIMVVGTFATVSAASTAKWYDAAVEALDNAGISNIGKDAAQPLTRNEFVMWIAKIESLQLSEDAWNDEIASVVFTDVTEAHHRAAIAYSYKANFIIGNGDGTFAPDKTLSLAEASAVIVRLMRYESKVTGLADEWDINYMRAASIYCRAFDQVFYKNSNTYDPDYQLTKGETAYILATIMNFINRDEDNLIKTADGIDLGARFDGMTPAAKENVYYIANLDRMSAGTATTNTYVSTTAASGVAGNRVEKLTNVIDVTKAVNLISADGTKQIVVDGQAFVSALRVSLGLAATPDTLNEEAEINVYEHINVGTLVNIKLADSVVFVDGVANVTNYKQIASFAVNSNSVVVDTILQYSLSNDEKLVGYAAAEFGSNSDVTNWKPVMNTSYDATMATSWTNIVKDATTGEITAATLNFKGVAYKYGSDIVAYDANWVPMTADEAVNTLINAAQGECYAVFNDVDADGLYDTVYVAESYAFAYATQANAQPTDNGTKYTYDLLTSTSNGNVVFEDTYLAWNNAGSVIFNREVGYPNSGGMMSSDSYNLTAANTGKLQLVLCAANARPAWDKDNCVPLYYTVVDLASFYTGIIEEVSADKVDGYYTARILCTDDVIRTVYIPVEASAQAKLNVTIGGATAEYTFDSTAWFTFLEETKAAATTAGIVQEGNLKDADYLTWTAAWMAGKYVEFSVNENNEVICILGTDAEAGTTGFVAGVEKTATGDNTYNVTIAVDGKQTATENIYFTQLTADNFHTSGYSVSEFTWSHKHIHPKNTIFTSGVNEDGETVYFIPDANGKAYQNADGILTDSKGRLLIDVINVYAQTRVNGLKTVEVRAAASGIFDWANYNVYNQLFAGSLIDPNTESNARVDAATDLVYVKLMKDAGSNYVLYNPNSEAATSSSYTYTYLPLNSTYGNNKWYYSTVTYTTNVAGSWADIEEGYFLSIEEIEGTRVPTEDAYGNENGYTALYDAKVGYGPHYERTWNTTSKTYTYELCFEKVVTYKNFEGTATAVIDTTKTYMIPLYENQNDASSNQVVADTDEKKAGFTINNGFYVDKDGKVFILVTATIVYKTDKDGNLVTEAPVYDYTTATETTEVTEVSFEDKETLGLENELAPYAVLTLTAKKSTDNGYFPGAYYLNLDGVKYNATKDTQVVVVTPSANGFAISTKTVAELANEGAYFVTEWSGVVGTGNTINNIAIVGEKASTGSTAVTPEPDVDDKTLVYLDGTASAFIRHDKYSNTWLVVSDKSAYALPTGEEVGAIYRSYPTYAEADNAIKIDLGIEGGKWYIIDENNQIVSSTEIALLEGTVTDVKADGTTIATMNGVANQVISTMKTEFFYFNAEKTLLNIAGDSTDVTIISSKAFGELFSSYEKAVAEAQTAYDAATVKYENGQLSDERYDYYKTNLENAEKALVDAKAANLDKYFNGQFWGFANSPLYKYVALAQGTFQEDKPTLTFNYVIVDDTLCVFSDSFSFGA